MTAKCGEEPGCFFLCIQNPKHSVALINRRLSEWDHGPRGRHNRRSAREYKHANVLQPVAFQTASPTQLSAFRYELPPANHGCVIEVPAFQRSLCAEIKDREASARPFALHELRAILAGLLGAASNLHNTDVLGFAPALDTVFVMPGEEFGVTCFPNPDEFVIAEQGCNYTHQGENRIVRRERKNVQQPGYWICREYA